MTFTVSATERRTVSFFEVLRGLLRLLPRLPSVTMNCIRLFLLGRKPGGAFTNYFGKTVRKFPHRPAIKFGETVISYRDLDRRINQVARCFAEAGVQKGDVLYLMMENRPELLIVFTALLKIGAVAAFIHPKLRGAGLLRILVSFETKGIVLGEECCATYLESLPFEVWQQQIRLFVPSTKDCVPPEAFVDLSVAASCMDGNSPVCPQLNGRDTAAILFTSGTTGLPKAVPIQHKRMVMSGIWFGKVLVPLTSRDTVYCPLPLYHAAGVAMGWPAAVMAGAAVAFDRNFSVTRLASDLRRSGATVLLYIGELLSYVLPAAEKKQKEEENELHTLLGSGLRPHLWQAARKWFGVRRIAEVYAATEAMGVFSNLLDLDGTVGFSFDSHAVVKLDTAAETPYRNEQGWMESVVPGSDGLLLFKLAAADSFGGYSKPKDGAENVFRNVFKKGDVWFNTKDLMRNLGYGHAAFVDRLGDTYRWKGENVSTSEVESVIQAYQGVRDAAVFGVLLPDTDGRAGMAVIATDLTGDSFDLCGLAAHLYLSLPRFAVPIFVRLTTQLGLTDTYKKNKSRLKEQGYLTGGAEETIFVCLPGKAVYECLTEEIEIKIDQGKIRF